MTASLELAKDAFAGHFALEVLDRTLDALVADGDLKGFTGNCFCRIRQDYLGEEKGPDNCQTLAACASDSCDFSTESGTGKLYAPRHPRHEAAA